MRWILALCALALSQTRALNHKEPNFITSLCKQWNCINENAGTKSREDINLDKQQLESYLSKVLDDKWKDSISKALDVCLAEKKPRAYSRSCSGQQTWHCVVDQLINNCPESLVKRDDACTPVSSFITAKFMFYQVEYANFKNESKTDPRPMQTLTTAFSSKCCDLPALFNTTLLKECGAETFMKVSSDQHKFYTSRQSASQFKYNTVVDKFCSEPLESVNPFECCDMSEIVKPSIFDSCSVKLEWQKEKRLVLVDETEAAPATEPSVETTTKKYHKKTDVKIVPQSCTGVTCVFRKLNITTDAGIDKDAFKHLLDNMVRSRPEWAPARARVLTHCLLRDLRSEYEGCDVSKLLACTYDILSEHCPHAKKGVVDPCRHPSKAQSTDVVCQVNLSKYRRTRHRYCDVPSLVPPAVLAQCNLTSLTHMTTTKREYTTSDYTFKLPSLVPLCKSTTNGTNCVLDKLGVLGKYKFMDYQRMKKVLDSSVEKSASWTSKRTQLEEAMRLMPHYSEHCVSTRRFLNILDSALETCPFNKRNYTRKCTKFYSYLSRCSPKKIIKTNVNTLAITTTNHNTAPSEHISASFTPISHSVHSIPGYNHRVVVPIAFRQPVRVHLPSAVYSPMYSRNYASQKAPGVQMFGGKPLDIKNVFKTNPRAEESPFRVPLEHPFPVDGNVYV